MKQDYIPPTQAERMKYTIAEEIGLLERVMEVGWAGLTTAESGRVGGLVARRLRSMREG